MPVLPTWIVCATMIKTYSKNIKQLGELAGIEVHTDPVKLENDDILLAQAGFMCALNSTARVQLFNDGEASGGQQVMKSLILLIGLFEIRRTAPAASSLSTNHSPTWIFVIFSWSVSSSENTDARYLMTTPLTHNTDVYDPSELTLITSKEESPNGRSPIFVLQRRAEKNKDARH